MLKTLFAALVVIVLGVGLPFYIVLRHRTADVSDREPFRALMGDPMKLQRDMQLVRVPEPERIDGSDELWELARPPLDNHELLHRFSAGATVTLHRAMIRTGGTSGVSNTIVFGAVRADGTDHPFSLYWGEYHFLNQEQPYWTFPDAPWNVSSPTSRYELPTP